MENEFVPYEFAMKLKELGFDEPCFGIYFTALKKDTDEPINCLGIDRTPKQDHYHGQKCSAPLWQQAFRWFRDKHKLFALPLNIGGDWRHLYDVFVYDLDADKEYEYPPMLIESYEASEYECLKLLIEILEERNEKRNSNDIK